jgi:2-iminobutanoate/2-iminopropanoate deaminase
MYSIPLTYCVSMGVITAGHPGQLSMSEYPAAMCAATSRSLVQLFGPTVEDLTPLGIRFGRTVYASNLTGHDGMPQALSTMCAVLEEAGATLDNVARVTAYVPSVAERDGVYGPWDTTFPDPQDRPAFKVLVAPLPAGVKVRLDMLAYVGGRRQRIDIPGVPARDPTVRMGDWVMTSRVHGTDPTTGKVADAEISQAVSNIETLTGGKEISQLIGFVRDATTKVVMDRPLTVVTNFVPPSMTLMLEAIAGTPAVAEVLTGGPIPDAICIDDLFFAPNIAPEKGDDFEAQLNSALTNMQTILERAGLTKDAVAHVTVYMPDVNLRPRLNTVWAEWFPNSADRPPHKYVPVDDLPPGQLVRLQVFAVRDAQRQVLDIPGMAHGDPMSMGVRMGDLVFSSRIVGTNTATGTTPPDPHEQARLAIDNVRTLLSNAGASPADLTQILAFITDDVDRSALLGALPAVGAPPTKFLNAHLPGGATVRLEVIASLSDGAAR